MTCLLIPGILCTLLVWGMVGPGMCKAMRALETLQCSGKDTVYKKEHPRHADKGWGDPSKLCAWCVGLVLKHGFLFHPDFCVPVVVPPVQIGTFCALYQVRGWVERSEQRAALVSWSGAGGSLGQGGVAGQPLLLRMMALKATTEPLSPTSPWAVGTTRSQAACTGDWQEYQSSVRRAALWASSDEPFHLLPPRRLGWRWPPH